MEFPEVIEKALEKQKVTSAKLAEVLGVRPQDLTAAKKGRRGLPDAACEKLAEVANEDFGDVIRARMRQRGFASTAVLWMTLAGAVLFSVVTSEVTTAPLKAAPLREVGQMTMYIMSTLANYFRRGFSQIIALARNSFPAGRERLSFASW